MSLVRVTDAATEPISVHEANEHLRISGCDEDVYVGGLIQAARRYVEDKTARSLMTTTWRLSLDEFPCGSYIAIPRSPLIAISSVTYVDTGGTTQTWAASNYDVDTDSEPARLALAYTEYWPSTRCQVNAVKVTFTAGYGASASSVPEGLKHAIKLLVGHWYEIREPVVMDGTPKPVPLSIDSLITQYRWCVYG